MSGEIDEHPLGWGDSLLPAGRFPLQPRIADARAGGGRGASGTGKRLDVFISCLVMNRDQLAKNIGRHVRLRPCAITTDGQRLDVDWQIVDVTDNRVELRRVEDGTPLRLGLDHVHRYSSDPERDEQPHAPYGFLVLVERVVRREDGRYCVEIVVPDDLERRLANQPPYTPDVLAEAQAQYGGLGDVLREAVGRLLFVGQMTDAQMQKYLSDKGLAHGLHSALQQLSTQTPLVLRLLPEVQHNEHVAGYKGPYVVNPVFKDALADVIARR